MRSIEKLWLCISAEVIAICSPFVLPVQFHELPSVAKPYSRPAKEVKALKVEAAMNWPDTTLLFRGA